LLKSVLEQKGTDKTRRFAPTKGWLSNKASHVQAAKMGGQLRNLRRSLANQQLELAQILDEEIGLLSRPLGYKE